MFKKLFEAGVLAVIEETARQLFPDFLAFAWMVILCALTWELLNHAKVKPYTLKLYRTVGVNHRMFSYIFAAVTGAVLLVGYWWTIEKIFTKPPKKVAAAPKENPAAIPIAQQHNPEVSKSSKGRLPGHERTTKVAVPKGDKTGNLVQQNSGGVNIQQGTTGPNSPIVNSPITIGQVPKRIATQDMATITGFLSSAKTKARVEITAEQSSNLIPLADDLYKTLKDAGWQMTQEGVNQFIGFSAPGKRFAGAVVTIKGEPLKPDEKVFFSPDEPMAYVGKVLESLGIPSILRREQSHAEDLISVEFEGTLNQSNQP